MSQFGIPYTVQTAKKNVLIVEDDAKINRIYQSILDPYFNLTITESLAAALDQTRTILFHAAIADLTLPDGDLRVLYQDPGWQQLFHRFPFMAVSGWQDVGSIDECLDRWAKDYLVKPFNPNELLVKTHRLILTQRPMRLDPIEMIVVKDGRRSKELTSTEFRIMSYLVQKPNFSSSQSELLQRAWGHERGKQKLHVALTRLRQKISDVGIEVTTDMHGCVHLQVQTFEEAAS